MKKRKVSWGIVGLGTIAHRFANDLVNQVEASSLYAVASRDLNKAKDFAEKYEVSHYFNSYEELASDPKVEVVYIATIHAFHKETTALFLNHGKHVLVEKPAFTCVADWDEMQNLAKSKGLLLVEAMKTVTFPAYRKLKAFISDHNLKIDHIEASFGTEIAYNENHWLFKKSLDGGAALDVGVYPLWLYCDLCDQLGVSVIQLSVSAELYPNGVNKTMHYNFEGSITGKLSASIAIDMPRVARISGDDLEIIIKEKWWNPQRIDIDWKGKLYAVHEPIGGGGFQFEAQHMVDLILNNQTESTIIKPEISREVLGFVEMI